MTNDAQAKILALRLHCLERVAVCQREELKFGKTLGQANRHGVPQALVEAWTERRTLEQVLDVIGPP